VSIPLAPLRDFCIPDPEELEPMPDCESEVLEPEPDCDLEVPEPVPDCDHPVPVPITSALLKTRLVTAIVFLFI